MKKIVIIFIVILLSLSGMFGIYKFYNSKKIDNKTTENIIKKNDEKKIEKNKASETKDDNQDREIKQMLNNQVQLIKDVINAEGAKFSENSLFDALTLKDLRYLQLRDTTTASLYFQEYSSLLQCL